MRRDRNTEGLWRLEMLWWRTGAEKRSTRRGGSCLSPDESGSGENVPDCSTMLRRLRLQKRENYDPNEAYESMDHTDKITLVSL